MPWWEPSAGTLIGALAGAGVGMLGGLVGTIVGVCAPRGVARRFILSMLVLFLAAAIATVAAGLVALAVDQPYHVWYPLLLIGGIPTLVIGLLFPVVRVQYRRADQRRLEAEQVRRG